MSETWRPAFDISRWRAEARMQAYGESDSALRMELMGALLAEGDNDAAPFAIDAMQQQPDTHDERAQGKVQALGETLATQKLFTEVDKVVQYLLPRRRYRGMHVLNAALANGYPGPGDSYLHMDFNATLAEAAALDVQPHYEFFGHIAAVGAFGKDIMNESSPHGRQLALGMALTPSSRQDYYLNSIVYRTAKAGKLATAVAAKDRILDPYWRVLSGMHIAEEVAGTDRTLSGYLLQEAYTRLDAVSNCDGSCGRMTCNPSINRHELEVKMALVHVKRGELDLADGLLGEIAPYAVDDQARVLAEAYKWNGSRDVRTAALDTVPERGFSRRPELTADLMYELARGDLRWGNFMPSPFDTDEPAPALCWELHEVFSRPSYYERKAANEGFSEEERASMGMLGLNAEDFVKDTTKARGEHRDYSIAWLAKIVAGLGSVQTAQHLVGQIEYPVAKVRALAGMAKALEEAG
jgi:hypothetical protein